MIPGIDCSYVSLGPPEVENAVATVTYYNTMIHGPHNDEHYDLTWNDVRVTIYYKWAKGNDTVTVLPYGGLTADPPEASVVEGTVQKYHLYEYLGS